MKTKKILLPGMLATMMFAACTNEDIVSQQTGAPEADLSKRPMVGLVDLNFGPQTRLGLDETHIDFNAIDWKEGDVMGARLIDTPNGQNWGVHSTNYKADNQYAYTNYKYTRNGNGDWTTDALLVEGNYMMYLPYDEDARDRKPLVVEFPMEQNINTKSELKDGANRDAIRDLYNDGWKFGFGHIFVDASKETFDYSVNYGHFYAYPQIQLVNNYTETVGEGEDSKEVPADLTISKIVIKSNNFSQYYSADHAGIITAMQDYVEEKRDPKWNLTQAGQDLGTWRNSFDALYNKTATADVLTATKKSGDKTNITLKFEPALVIPADESYKLNVVMPAATYAQNNISLEVYGSESTRLESDGKVAQFKNEHTLTYVPGKRFPREEYNFVVADKKFSTKDTKGTLATFKLKGNMNSFTPVIEGVQTLEELITILETVVDNTDAVKEGTEDEGGIFTFAKDKDGYAMVKMNQALVDALNKYLDKGSIEFTTPMIVEGDVTLSSNVEKGCDIKSVGALNQTNGTLTLEGVEVNDGESKFAGEVVFGNMWDGMRPTLNGKVILTGTVSGIAKVNGTVESSANGSIGGEITEELTVRGGSLYVTATAASAEVYGGSTVSVTAANQLGNIIVRDYATLNLNCPNYNGEIELGRTEWNNETRQNENRTGTLNVNAEQQDLNLNEVYAVVENNAEIKLANTTIKGSWTNNSTIASDLNVTGSYVHAEKANVSGTITNSGTLTNKGDIVVSTNNGTIKADGKATHTTVEAGNGTVENNSLAYVEANAGQTVSYAFNSAVNENTINEFDAETYSINKIIFNAPVTLNKALSTKATTMRGVKTLEFNANLTVAANAQVGVGVERVEINNNVTFSGFDKSKSGLGFKNNVTIAIAKGKTLNVNYLTIAALKDGNKVDFSLEQNAKLQVKNAIVAVGSSVVPAYKSVDGGLVQSGYYNANNGEVESKDYVMVENVYTVNSPVGLKKVAALINADNNGFSGKTIKLGNDINLNNEAWTPIENFKGIFDGNSKTIYGLNVEGKSNVGFFGYSTNLTVKNLTIDGAVVKGNHHVGTLVGYLYGNIESCKILNASVSCSYLNKEEDGDKAGALVGLVAADNHGNVSKCTAENCTVNAVRDAGQIAGAAKSTMVVNCSVKNVTVTGTGNNIKNEIIGRQL